MYHQLISLATTTFCLHSTYKHLYAYPPFLWYPNCSCLEWDPTQPLCIIAYLGLDKFLVLKSIYIIYFPCDFFFFFGGVGGGVGVAFEVYRPIMQVRTRVILIRIWWIRSTEEGTKFFFFCSFQLFPIIYIYIFTFLSFSVHQIMFIMGGVLKSNGW